MKKVISIICILLLLTFTLYATPIFKTSFNFEYSYDTNVFSNPLPSYEAPSYNGQFNWLENKVKNPFIQKHSLGGSISLDIFFSKTTRTGISTSINIKAPIYAITTFPIPDTDAGFRGDWHYQKKESTKEQKTSIFWGIGPIFMAQMKQFDIGCAIRVSLGSYDYIDNELILGIQAEPFIHIYLPHNIFLNMKLTYDAHIMRFICNDSTEIYTPYYQMVSAAPSIGIGFRF